MTVKEVRGFKEGDKVRSLITVRHWYEEGKEYTVGFDEYGVFGVLDCDGDVIMEGILEIGERSIYDPSQYNVDETVKNFVLVD